jgi:hypothetical protein
MTEIFHLEKKNSSKDMNLNSHQQMNFCYSDKTNISKISLYKRKVRKF